VTQEATTMPAPVVRPEEDRWGTGTAHTGGSPGAAGGFRAGEPSGSAGVSDSEVTAELPQPPAPSGAADDTAVLPPVPPGAAEDTAVLPPLRGGGTEDRVPPGYFRDERPVAGRPDGSGDRTRELPQVDADGAPKRRARSDWAEETPLDDLPTLADELLGPHRDEDGSADDPRGRRG
jgi:dTMP kinase